MRSRLANKRITGGADYGFSSAVPTRKTCNPEYGGLRTDQAHRLKELERENVRLKKLVADLALDKAMLQEALSAKP